jgi:hypothetical protein
MNFGSVMVLQFDRVDSYMTWVEKYFNTFYNSAGYQVRRMPAWNARRKRFSPLTSTLVHSAFAMPSDRPSSIKGWILYLC